MYICLAYIITNRLMYVQCTWLCTYIVNVYVRTVHISQYTPLIYEMIVSKFARGLGLKERERGEEKTSFYLKMIWVLLWVARIAQIKPHLENNSQILCNPNLSKHK